MRGLLVFLSVAAIALLAANANALANEAPDQYCGRVVNDDTLRQPPEALTPTIDSLFGLSNAYPPGAAFYRCAGGNVMVCVVGANLPCGKANTSTELPAAQDWCRTNPDASFIPMYITGHDTIYHWRCTGTAATATGQAAKVDGRGFFADYWRQLP